MTPPLQFLDAPSFYDHLAVDYDRQFEAVHRRAYDDLAWELVTAHLPPAPAQVVDVGCGVGRWAPRLLSRGYRVTGIDPSEEMVEHARSRGLPDAFEVRCASVDDVTIAAGTVDAVIAMGSVQYAPDPPRSIARMAAWLRPGGSLAVLGDSRLALALELLAGDRTEEALQRAATGRAVFRHEGAQVQHHLFDAAGLRRALTDAGLVNVTVSGLLVSWSSLGRHIVMQRLADDRDGMYDIERRLARCEPLADAGKQLLAIGHRPG